MADPVPSAGRDVLLEPAYSPPLSAFPRAVRQADKPLRAIVVGWLLAFLPSLALSMAVTALASDAARPEFGPPGPMLLFSLVVIAPVLETLIMGAALLVLLRFLPPTGAVIASAIGWGIAHSLLAPVWGLVIWWPFIIFSTLFVTWRQRSLVAAFAVPAATHALQNSVPGLLLLSGLAT